MIAVLIAYSWINFARITASKAGSNLMSLNCISIKVTALLVNRDNLAVSSLNIDY